MGGSATLVVGEKGKKWKWEKRKGGEEKMGEEIKGKERKEWKHRKRVGLIVSGGACGEEKKMEIAKKGKKINKIRAKIEIKKLRKKWYLIH